MVLTLLSKKQNRKNYSYQLSDHIRDLLVSFQVAQKKELHPEIFKQLECILYCSRYAQQLFIKYPDLFLQFSHDGDFKKPIKAEHIEQELFDILLDASSLDDICYKVRYFRHYHHLRILVNDLVGFFDMKQTMRELSKVCDVIIGQTVQCIHKRICDEYELDSHSIAPLTIIAMGKLGGQELNFSSDIDLIFGYPRDWEFSGMDAERFYILQAKQFMKIINQQNQDGFVYRVDLRLRPFGEEGAMVLPYSGFENYYHNYGRAWERYALVKARIIFGEQGSKVEAVRRKFVYESKTEDEAIATLRELKQLIEKEALSRHLQLDIKRGLGGIRQVEFFVQLFQLIHGSENKKLRTHQWYTALKELKKTKLISLEQYELLKQGYYFLREIEHYLQIDQDKQTHMLPKIEADQNRLACCMRYPDWTTLEIEINRVRKEINELFENLLKDPDSINKEENLTIKNLSTSLSQQLEVQNFIETDYFKALDEIGKQFCMDMLNTLEQGDYKQDDIVLERLIALLSVIADSESYRLLFNTNTKLAKHVISLFNQSPWCARNLKQYPSLLHELASMKALSAPTPVEKLSDELRQVILPIPEGDIEQLSEALRKFKLRQFMKVAYSDVKGSLPLMKVSDHLTFTAEVIVKYLYLHLKRSLLNESPDIDEPIFDDFCIIAYGKLGGIELSYQSDLDLVFLYSGPSEHERSYIRMAQRLIALLEKPLRTGKLYEIDTRLRPSGHAGLLANSFSAFESYLEQSAWTWEYQALIRARFIAGSDSARAKFDAIRLKILTKQRDLTMLKKEVFEMRERLRRQKINQYGSECYARVAEAVKDIEFIVQFLSLLFSSKFPEIIKWSDNIRILEVIAALKILDADVVETLIDAYQLLRAKLHEYALKEHFQLDDQTEKSIEFVQEQEKKILMPMI